MNSFIVPFLIVVWGNVEAYGRYSMVAKQHETPLNLIDESSIDFRDSDRTELTDEWWPKAKEVLVHQKAHEASGSKKFDLEEVEVWVTLASVMGALLALLGFQICRLCKTKTRNRMDSSRQMIENVIDEGLEAAAKTKKVVVMNIHLVPCGHHVHPYSKVTAAEDPNTAPQHEHQMMLMEKSCSRKKAPAAAFNV